MRVLLDVHALLDMVNKNPSEDQAIGQLKVMHEFRDAELWVSVLTFSEFASAVERAIGPETSIRLIEDSLSWIRVCSVESAEVIAALSIEGPSWRERVELACAERIEANFVIMRNADSRFSIRIPHGSVADFIRHVKRTTNVQYAVVDL